MILHIFRKDVRRLWPQIAVTLVLLAALARQDRWRADRMAGTTEGWLNLLLLLAWACLIGLAIGEEPLTGDREFWLTRPYRRPQLLAAKVLFLVALIHIPSLLADSWVLAARGFSPLPYLPELIWKQVLLAGALTIPAMALAALVRNFTQFMLLVVTLTAAMIFVSGALEMFHSPWSAVELLRQHLAILVGAAVGSTIVFLQYFGRRELLSRALGIGGAVAAGLISGWLLPQTAFALRAAVHPAGTHPELRITGPRPHDPIRGRPSGITVAIPIELTGIPAGTSVHAESLFTEIEGQDGAHFESAIRAGYSPFEKIPFYTFLSPGSRGAAGPEFLVMTFDRSTFERLRKNRVGIAGQTALTFYHPGETTWMETSGAAAAAGVGTCRSGVVEDRFAEGMLKVECESPSSIPVTRVRLWDPETGRDWKERLNSGGTYVAGPRMTWLSPLDRSQTFFRLAENPVEPGSQWLVPNRALSTAKIAITPEIVTGYSVLRYDFRGLSLNDFADR